jgi:hypothetical protein
MIRADEERDCCALDSRPANVSTELVLTDTSHNWNTSVGRPISRLNYLLGRPAGWPAGWLACSLDCSHRDAQNGRYFSDISGHSGRLDAETVSIPATSGGWWASRLRPSFDRTGPGHQIRKLRRSAAPRLSARRSDRIPRSGDQTAPTGVARVRFPNISRDESMLG